MFGIIILCGNFSLEVESKAADVVLARLPGKSRIKDRGQPLQMKPPPKHVTATAQENPNVEERPQSTNVK